MVRFMPTHFELTETRQRPLIDPYDEGPARVIGYGFSARAKVFASAGNRTMSQRLGAQLAQAGFSRR